jgi:hypothetical protein
VSLQTLINLRRQKVAPASVWLLVGDKPAWLTGREPDLIHVPATTRQIDLRALIGLHVDVIECGDHYAALDAVLEALDSAKPKSRGLACLAGVAGLNPAHERILDNARRMLCN